MKLSKNRLRSLILEAVQKKEIKESEIRKVVIACLKEEGGAAGMNLIIKQIEGLKTKTKEFPKNLRSNKDLIRFVLKMDNVVKHRYGDIILTTGLPKRKK